MQDEKEKTKIAFRGKDKQCLTRCPYCKSNEVEALSFETDIEGINPVADLPYRCEKCGKRWTLEFKPTIIIFDEPKPAVSIIAGNITKDKFIHENFIVCAQGDFHVRKYKDGWGLKFDQNKILEWGSMMCLACDSSVEIEIKDDDMYIDSIERHIQQYHPELNEIQK